MAVTFNKLTETGPLPEWLTAAVTFLIPKNENTENPKNYRPVTGLPTAYKLLTADVCRHTWMITICYQNNRKGAAEELKDAKITCSSQKQLYKIANERKKI